MQTASADATFLNRVAYAADRDVRAFLETHDDDAQALAHRPAMGRLLAMVAVFTEPGSAFHGSAVLHEPMGRCLDRLELLQGPTGLFDGTNLCSPPDSAFTLNDVCLALGLLRALDTPPEPLLAEVDHRLSGIVARATDALVTGGVHTPNHRWELCAALAQINQLQPRQDIADRIGEWLAEGIDQLPDGMYSERSPLYATAVTNPSLITIADSAGRPELLDHVRRNLTAFLPWFNPDGTVETLFSRRQDQWMDFDAAPFLRLYRRLASQDGRQDFAAVAGWLAELPLHEPAKLLALARLDPWLRAALPAAQSPEGALPPPDAEAARPELPAPARAALESCGAFRFREGKTVATVFGGCDDLVPGVVSGLATNPTFLRFAHGSAVLAGVRLSRSFFDLGPFRSQHTTLAGTTVSLAEELSANFYLPLPVPRRRADGIYALEHEGRFSAGMGFTARPAVVHRLATDLTVQVDHGQVTVDIAFDGADTAFALELTFQPGGVLDGVIPAGAPETFQLVDGVGSYRSGTDIIEFGPGSPADPDTPPAYNPGESYRYLAGTNASEGVKVYITGRTTGSRRFTFRGVAGRQ
ncbi:hypothetical protein [Pseudarthrobacter sp. NamE5]|uniref:hypothetical protein n=1 Tax=Pseudarthrobacter sp. NamE5 TaxID=2576839 RepID=UPI00110B854F|nr:hypothetical protein [Pseudarthrobacter sp. NamE5]TLM84636.1 hypothetical protein FDW84_10980 [Pseudarthrobacter sp. NamE5]